MISYHNVTFKKKNFKIQISISCCYYYYLQINKNNNYTKYILF